MQLGKNEKIWAKHTLDSNPFVQTAALSLDFYVYTFSLLFLENMEFQLCMNMIWTCCSCCCLNKFCKKTRKNPDVDKLELLFISFCLCMGFSCCAESFFHVFGFSEMEHPCCIDCCWMKNILRQNIYIAIWFTKCLNILKKYSTLYYRKLKLVQCSIINIIVLLKLNIFVIIIIKKITSLILCQ